MVVLNMIGRGLGKMKDNFQQRELLIKLVMDLQDCTYAEARDGVYKIPADELEDEINWINEMLDK